MKPEASSTGHIVVNVQDRVDRGPGGRPILQDRLPRLLDEGYKSILLNLADVSYFDSMLLGELIHAHTSAIRRGATVKLLYASKRCLELLRITKLDKVLETVESEQAPPPR
jgi:anti-anti-sigma factor